MQESNDGLIQYNGKYILVDKSEGKKLYEQISNANHKKMTRLELIHASMSGQLQDYDFNYDEAYANVIKDFAKPVEFCYNNFVAGKCKSMNSTGGHNDR